MPEFTRPPDAESKLEPMFTSSPGPLLRVGRESPLCGTVKEGRQPTLGRALGISLGKTLKWEVFHLLDPRTLGGPERHVPLALGFRGAYQIVL